MCGRGFVGGARRAACPLAKGSGMHTYLTFFTYSKETWRAMVQKPEDRSEAARKLIEAAAGHLLSFHLLLG